MTECKQLEESYIDYVCDLLNEKQVAHIDEHLRGCSTCNREIQSLQKTLRLTEEAEEMPIPSLVLDNIERNVYKRLATKSPSPKRTQPFSKYLAALRLFNVKRRPVWIFRSALATLMIVITISIAMILISQNQSPDSSISAIPIESPRERIKLYHQEEIQNNYTEALETRHLKGNDRLATLKLLVLAEQAP